MQAPGDDGSSNSEVSERVAGRMPHARRAKTRISGHGVASSRSTVSMVSQRHGLSAVLGIVCLAVILAPARAALVSSYFTLSTDPTPLYCLAQTYTTRLPFSPAVVKAMTLSYVGFDWTCVADSPTAAATDSAFAADPSALAALTAPGAVAVVVGAPCTFASWDQYRGAYLAVVSAVAAAGASGLLFIEGLNGKLPEQMLAQGVPTGVPTCILGRGGYGVTTGGIPGAVLKSPSDAQRLITALGLTATAAGGLACPVTTFGAVRAAVTGVGSQCVVTADFSTLPMYAAQDESYFSPSVTLLTSSAAVNPDSGGLTALPAGIATFNPASWTPPNSSTRLVAASLNPLCLSPSSGDYSSCVKCWALCAEGLPCAVLGVAQGAAGLFYWGAAVLAPPCFAQFHQWEVLAATAAMSAVLYGQQSESFSSLPSNYLLPLPAGGVFAPPLFLAIAQSSAELLTKALPVTGTGVTVALPTLAGGIAPPFQATAAAQAGPTPLGVYRSADPNRFYTCLGGSAAWNPPSWGGLPLGVAPGTFNGTTTNTVWVQPLAACRVAGACGGCTGATAAHNPPVAGCYTRNFLGDPATFVPPLNSVAQLAGMVLVFNTADFGCLDYPQFTEAAIAAGAAAAVAVNADAGPPLYLSNATGGISALLIPGCAAATPPLFDIPSECGARLLLDLGALSPTAHFQLAVPALSNTTATGYVTTEYTQSATLAAANASALDSSLTLGAGRAPVLGIDTSSVFFSVDRICGPLGLCPVGQATFNPLAWPTATGPAVSLAVSAACQGLSGCAACLQQPTLTLASGVVVGLRDSAGLAASLSGAVVLIPDPTTTCLSPISTVAFYLALAGVLAVVIINGDAGIYTMTSSLPSRLSAPVFNVNAAVGAKLVAFAAAHNGSLVITVPVGIGGSALPLTGHALRTSPLPTGGGAVFSTGAAPPGASPLTIGLAVGLTVGLSVAAGGGYYWYRRWRKVRRSRAYNQGDFGGDTSDLGAEEEAGAGGRLGRSGFTILEGQDDGPGHGEGGAVSSGRVHDAGREPPPPESLAGAVRQPLRREFSAPPARRPVAVQMGTRDAGT